MIYFRQPTLCFMMAFLLVQAGGLLSAADRAGKFQIKPIRIKHYRQLFLDDYLIDDMQAIRRNVHSAEKHSANPIVHGDHAWLDGFAYLYGAVERDPKSNHLRVVRRIAARVVRWRGSIPLQAQRGPGCP